MSNTALNLDESSVEQVVNHIRDRIVSGDFSPNMKLRPNEIADQCGTSFIPVREAMRVLETEGLITYIHNRGAFATPISESDLQDLYSIRIELEPTTVAISNPFTPGEIAELAKILSKIVRARERNEDDQIMRLNREFHFGIYKKSNSPRRIKLIEQLLSHADRYQRLSLQYRHDAADTEHQEILNHLSLGNNVAAAHSLSSHLKTTAKLLTAAFDDIKNCL